MSGPTFPQQVVVLYFHDDAGCRLKMVCRCGALGSVRSLPNSTPSYGKSTFPSHSYLKLHGLLDHQRTISVGVMRLSRTIQSGVHVCIGIRQQHLLSRYWHSNSTTAVHVSDLRITALLCRGEVDLHIHARSDAELNPRLGCKAGHRPTKNDAAGPKLSKCIASFGCQTTDSTPISIITIAIHQRFVRARVPESWMLSGTMLVMTP